MRPNQSPRTIKIGACKTRSGMRPNQSPRTIKIGACKTRSGMRPNQSLRTINGACKTRSGTQMPKTLCVAKRPHMRSSRRLVVHAWQPSTMSRLPLPTTPTQPGQPPVLQETQQPNGAESLVIYQDQIRVGPEFFEQGQATFGGLVAHCSKNCMVILFVPLQNCGGKSISSGFFFLGGLSCALHFLEPFLSMAPQSSTIYLAHHQNL
jgi:hypothetical protein